MAESSTQLPVPMRIDTHRHLGGCIPVDWVWKTVLARGWSYIGESYNDIRSAMTFSEEEPRDFHLFLDKFRILDSIRWDEELIDSSIAAICEAIEAEDLDFTWLDLSINKYLEPMNWHKKEAITFIYESFQRHLPNRVGLILSLKYESMRAGQRQYAKLIEDPDICDMLFGLDLIGDEAHFDYEFYAPIFRDWNNAGKMTRAHAAESQDAINGLNAIRYLKATNIAHGINMTMYPDMLSEARDSNVTFDLGISSNYITGVWTNPDFHPVKTMLDAGLNVTIGTDDPVQCGSSLDDEFEFVKTIGVTDLQILQMKMTAEINTLLFLRNRLV